MRLTVRTTSAPDRPIDVTHAVTAAIAHELWVRAGGNEVLNWVEAERLVASLAAAATPRRGSAARPRGAPVASAGREARAPRHKRDAAARDPERVTGPIPILGPR